MIQKFYHLIWILGVVALVATTGFGGLPPQSKEKSKQSHNKRSPEGTKKEVQGKSEYRVYINPVTGRFEEGPPEGQVPPLSPELEYAVSSSSEGLQETSSPVPGGGIMIDLQGRFQNAMVGTIDAKGNLQAPCTSVGSPAAKATQGKSTTGYPDKRERRQKP